MEFDSEERFEGILSVLEEHGQASVAELSERFGVSAVTIRKDLDALERRSLLTRFRGGARFFAATEEGSFGDRLRSRVTAKKAIARRAAALVPNGASIGLDSSTTSYYLALELLGHHDLLVVTNSLRTAALFESESQATVVLMGGTVRRTSQSTVGDLGETMAGRGHLSMSFFGLTSLSLQRGLMEMATSEAESKRALLQASNEVVAIFDSSKDGAFGLHSFAAPSQVNRIITDNGFNAIEADRWRAMGVVVDVVEPRPAHFATAAEHPTPTSNDAAR
ncbi:MAG: DeoR/GlpR family DNA-binding transcription regulator [Microbacterium sp.]